MSDPPGDDAWWGDESPVGTDPRANGRAVGGPPRRDGPPRREGPPVDGPRRGDERPPPRDPRNGGPPLRSRAQVFVPAPEDLPPLDEFGDPIRDDPPVPAGIPDAPVPSPVPAGIPDRPVPAPAPARTHDGVPPAPVLDRPRRPRPAAPPPRRRAPAIDRRRLAVVYDVDGPRVRLGVAWFAGAMAATALSEVTTAVVFAAAAGLAARQVVRAWGSVPWQADVAAGMAAVPVLAALFGAPAAVVAVVLALAVAVGAAAAPDGARMPGPEGRVAAVGILALSLVPALAAAVVLVRVESVVAATVLLLLAGAYEMGDFIVGSGASNPVEGPLAGVTTATLVSLPLALVLVEPYDAAGVALLAFTAAACPLGQVVASAALPGAGAPAPALRRIDTLLVLGPIWVAAAGAL